MRGGAGKTERDRRDHGDGHGSTRLPRRKGKCRKCGVYGHWGKECPNKKKAKEYQGEVANTKTDAVSALLVA